MTSPTSATGYAGWPPAEDKRAVRVGLRARRRALVPHRDREADATAIAEAGLAVVEDAGLPRGSWVSVYEAMPVEAPTHALIDLLRSRGYRVMVPFTLPDLDLDWLECGGDGSLLGAAAIAAAPVVFLPALAVDRSGTRLGKGGGSYDRALVRAPRAHLVAVVHPWEVLDEPLPCEAHDRRVRAALTADGLEPLGG